jgi:hypothetical protein
VRVMATFAIAKCKIENNGNNCRKKKERKLWSQHCRQKPETLMLLKKKPKPLRGKKKRSRWDMDRFPKLMVIIKFQVNSNFYNKVIFRSEYVCEYFNHDKSQGVRYAKPELELTSLTWLFRYPLNTTSFNKLVCMWKPCRPFPTWGCKPFIDVNHSSIKSIVVL